MRLIAEVIAIGDELTSGQRLDTNTQWLSRQLGELGIQVAFHTTVGDVHSNNVDVFRIASERADIVISTGGLGPTADDLTRQSIAESAGVELELHPHVVEHIRKIFAKYSREMPESNKIQAYFPVGSEIVDNPEGTAPGIDFVVPATSGGTACRIFALPGVPAEMKQMWKATVAGTLSEMLGISKVIHHHTIHCFGIGESRTEQMLPDLIRRDREPRVGITASSATISLRVAASGDSVEDCYEKMNPTLSEIKTVLGDLVFGENGKTLEEVVVEKLEERSLSVAIFDLGLNGDVGSQIQAVDADWQPLQSSLSMSQSSALDWLGRGGNETLNLEAAAQKVSSEFSANIGIAIGPLIGPAESNPIATFHVAIVWDGETYSSELSYAGHSAFRHLRSVKQVLNLLRLLLKNGSLD